jgi:crotonobetainyl-CoA:carnitine CoA-transferase CaiB-like acyl-CoA transferase
MTSRKSRELPSPLAGIRVLEVASWLAAPCAAALLADMGAEVVKVEPPEGDAWRHIRPDIAGFAGKENPAFHLDNRGKRSIAIDLGHEEGRDIVRALAARADVFVSNLGPARAKRYGLAYRDVRRVNPGVVYLQFTGYGARGPQRDRPGFDDVAFWAGSGIMASLAEPGGPPARAMASIGDHTTALALLSGLLAALVQRERTGKGQYLQGSLFATGLWVQGDIIQNYLETGIIPPKRERMDPPLALWNIFPLKDGRWVMIAMDSARFWPRLCRALGLADGLATDPGLLDEDELHARRKEVAAYLEGVFATRTLRDITAPFREERLIWAPITRLEEALHSPQVKANGFIADLPDGFSTLNLPVRFEGARVEPRGVSPAIGEHTDEVLAELGFDAARVAGLRDAGVVGPRPPGIR